METPLNMRWSVNKKGYLKQLFSWLAVFTISINLSQAKLSYHYSGENKDSATVNLLVPIMYSTPETELAFGMAGTSFFKINKNDTNQRVSSVRGLCVYTLKKQIIFQTGATCFFRDENFIFKITADFLHYPDKFYGIGNNVSKKNFESYTYQQVDAYPRLLRRIMNRFFIGLQYRFCSLTHVFYQQNGIFDNMNYLGKNGGNCSGVGILFDFDSRDNIFNSYRGSYLDISYMYYDKVFGSDFSYKFFTFDYRKFWRLYKLNILALQFYSNINFGQPPFNELALMGGNSLMRGIYSGMYRDRKYVSGQIELRTPLWWRIGLVTFAGCGEIGSRFSEYDTKFLKYSYGAGLRLMLKDRERINLRIDYGVSNTTSGWYLTVTESF